MGRKKRFKKTAPQPVARKKPPKKAARILQALMTVDTLHINSALMEVFTIYAVSMYVLLVTARSSLGSLNLQPVLVYTLLMLAQMAVSR